MNKQFLNIQNTLKNKASLPYKRREVLIKEMSKLEDQKKDCFSCSGMCCTYEYNSMLVTPIECFEMLNYLVEEDRVNQELVTRLKSNIAQYRLDKDMYSTKGKEFRRYYTCPFFKNENKGCSISRSSKPYGCLGFNPNEESINTPGKCGSNLENLQSREDEFCSEESVANEYLSKELKLYWDKKPISVALVEFINKIIKL
jgi:hypothetical protein